MTGKPIVFGEVLFDHFPDGSRVLGGAPFNVAWHLQALGLDPLFISRVGDDALGNEIRAAMKGWGMTTAGLQQDSSHPTGTVEVSLEDGEPAYDIVPQRAYDYISSGAFPPAASAAGIIYHGTLATRDDVSQSALDDLLAHGEAPVFLDVNLRDPWWQRDPVLARIHRADHLKLNEDELDALLPDAMPLAQRVRGIMDAFDLTTVVVTRGSAGAEGFSRDGGTAMAAPKAVVDVVDTVGAGDSFAAVLITGLLQGWPLQDTLDRAQDMASAIVGRRGATVDDDAFYHTLRRQWSL
ncbi:MAG: carbohydrate kinase [Gammaproteobacteria bacterium]|nr:carbohydrate kinase [Gammaproteobacteria bacterium]